jgi:hypothetical protein
MVIDQQVGVTILDKNKIEKLLFETVIFRKLF